MLIVWRVTLQYLNEINFKAPLNLGWGWDWSEKVRPFLKAVGGPSALV